MADLFATGPLIAGGAQSALFKFYLPCLKLDKPSVNVAGPGTAPEKHTFHALQPAGAAAAFPVPSTGTDNSEIFIETLDCYPFNDFMGQQVTT